MILVVEGISAAGKTTWCQSMAPGRVIAEASGTDRDVTDGGLDAARHWTRVSCRRWSEALRVEAEHGLAVCDTDPLKLHYAWSLWRIGAGRRSVFERQREAFAQERLGFADNYIVIRCDPSEARLRRDRDPARRRRRFDLHVRLQDSFVAWYTVLGQTVGRPIDWTMPGEMPSRASFDRNTRCDLRAFDAFLSAMEQL